jgi:hypothetical protein
VAVGEEEADGFAFIRGADGFSVMRYKQRHCQADGCRINGGL